jgi:uncharacterized membrane protein
MTSVRPGWDRHPGVRSGSDLALGDRAADRMRNGMGSWTFVFCALAFLAIWMLTNGRRGFDPFPYILLNLILSCLAALQGAILLIAARRSDQIAAELAQHDYATDQKAEGTVEQLATSLAALTGQHDEMRRQIAELTRLVRSLAPDTPTPAP